MKLSFEIILFISLLTACNKEQPADHIKSDTKYRYSPLLYSYECINDKDVPIKIIAFDEKNIVINLNNVKNSLTSEKIARGCTVNYKRDLQDISSATFTYKFNENEMPVFFKSNLPESKFLNCMKRAISELDMSSIYNGRKEVNIVVNWENDVWYSYVDALNRDDFTTAIKYAQIAQDKTGKINPYFALSVQMGKKEVSKQIMKMGPSMNDTIGLNEMSLIECVIFNGNKELVEQFLGNESFSLNYTHLEKYIKGLKESCLTDVKMKVGKPVTGCFPEIIKMLEEYKMKKNDNNIHQ